MSWTGLADDAKMTGAAPAAAQERAGAVVVGGGFYGCCLALFLRSIADDVVILEQGDDLLTRASYCNQARIHTGFHYPRSFVTARRSLALYRRFIEDFRPAVVDNFTMLYAIARYGSKVTPDRFVKMYEAMGAPLSAALKKERALFPPALIAEVLRCEEYAFNAAILRRLMRERLERAGVRLEFGVRVEEIRANANSGGCVVMAAERAPIAAPVVFDATYGQLCNRTGQGAAGIPFKYEMTEIALVEPPPELAQYGVTVMDGPFFSIMPFPARGCHSLTHVRYTPHEAWSWQTSPHEPQQPHSRWLHMQRDAARFLPCLKGLQYKESLFETKTVLMRNESDDGRPILLHRDPLAPGFMTVLGGKVDNIYDLFEALAALGPPFDRADLRHLSPGGK